MGMLPNTRFCKKKIMVTTQKLLVKVFEFLNSKNGKITNQYMKQQLALLDKI